MVHDHDVGDVEDIVEGDDVVDAVLRMAASDAERDDFAGELGARRNCSGTARGFEAADYDDVGRFLVCSEE